MMRPTKETLTAALTNLRQALVNPGSCEGVSRLESALAAVEGAVHRQDAHLEALDGDLVGIDYGQARSPTMDRRSGQLQEELADLLEEASTLRGRLRRMLQNGTWESRLHLDGVLRRSAALADHLERYEKEETRLVLEAVTTDVGSGE
jgi:hypothetical protein